MGNLSEKRNSSKPSPIHLKQNQKKQASKQTEKPKQNTNSQDRPSSSFFNTAWTQCPLKTGASDHTWPYSLILAHSPGFVWMQQWWSKGILNPHTSLCRLRLSMQPSDQKLSPPHPLISPLPPPRTPAPPGVTSAPQLPGQTLLRPQSHLAAGPNSTMFYQNIWVNPFHPRELHFWG